MVAIFTARKPIEQIAFEKSAGIEPFPDQHLYPDAQFKGAVLYTGRVQVTMPAPGGQVAFELLDGTYADAGIVATDEIFIEADDLAIAGAWTVGTVTDPSSSLQTTRTSNRRLRASVTSWSSAGRRSFAPETPRSTKSTAVQPRASA